jgi:hypothetical protein
MHGDAAPAFRHAVHCANLRQDPARARRLGERCPCEPYASSVAAHDAWCGVVRQHGLIPDPGALADLESKLELAARVEALVSVLLRSGIVTREAWAAELDAFFAEATETLRRSLDAVAAATRRERR